MVIRKQEFYEGAALHLLARTGAVGRLHYSPPFFLINDRVTVLLKYCTKGRSPWGFTFTAEEQQSLALQQGRLTTFIGMVCGSDGVAALPYGDFARIAAGHGAAVHISCYRSHREHYEVNGPAGALPRKVAPSDWLHIFDR